MTPTQHATQQLAIGLARALDERIAQAITTRLGAWELGDLAGRLSVIHNDSGSTYFLDGAALLRADPPSLECNGTMLSVTQRFAS